MASVKMQYPLGMKVVNSEITRVDALLTHRGIVGYESRWDADYWSQFFKKRIEEANTIKNFEKTSGMEGQVTYDSEGDDIPDSKYFSRKVHVPSNNSGVTIGRGYDMKLKNKNKIKQDLVASGINITNANKLSLAAGKSGNTAKQYIKNNKLDKIIITNEQQKKLFSISYNEIKEDVQRICNKSDIITVYGSATDLKKTHYAIREITVDLRFRGDYTPSSRTFLQKHIINNDLEKFKNEICNKQRWNNVPKNRFDRRCNYLNSI